jgi:hypothetical protein
MKNFDDYDDTIIDDAGGMFVGACTVIAVILAACALIWWLA